MSFLEAMGWFRRVPATRTAEEIESDIEDEIEFHLAMRARELVEAGLAPEAARAAALVRFGDARRVRTACRRIQMGERSMLARWNAVATGILLALAAYLGWQLASSRAETARLMDSLHAQIEALADAVQAGETHARSRGVASGVDALAGDGAGREPLVASPPSAQQAPVEPAAWLALFHEGQTWSDVVTLGNRIVALGPERALEVMRAIYPDLPTVFARQQILKSFVFDGGTPETVEVLDLAATDPELAVQGWAYGYLLRYAFQDFSADHDAYLAWYARFGGRPVGEILEQNARELAARLANARPDELALALRSLDGLDLSAGPKAGVELDRVLRDSGILPTLATAVRDGDDEARQNALEWVREVRAEEPFLRAEVLPLLDGSRPASDEVASAACRALGRRGNTFAVEPLLASLSRAGEESYGSVYAHAMALAEIGDARAIPGLIALIGSATTSEQLYGIGYYGLKDLTGVSYDASHDGAFWRQWWSENRDRLPAEAASMELPALSFVR